MTLIIRKRNGDQESDVDRALTMVRELLHGDSAELLRELLGAELRAERKRRRAAVNSAHMVTLKQVCQTCRYWQRDGYVARSGDKTPRLCQAIGEARHPAADCDRWEWVARPVSFPSQGVKQT